MSEEDKKVSFYYKNLWQKLFIVVAGPLANVIFCLVLMSAVYFFNGVYKIDPIIMSAEQGKAAYNAGIRDGDQIVKINETDIESTSDVAQSVLGSFGRPMDITVRRDGQNIIFEDVSPDTKLTEQGDKISYIGVYFSNIPYVLSTQKGFPAADAGIQTLDLIHSVDGQETPFTSDVVRAVQMSKNETIQFEVKRGEDIISLALRPHIDVDENQKEHRKVGIVFVTPKLHVFEYDIMKSIRAAYHQTISIAVLSWEFFVGLFQGYAEAEQLSGPIKIGSIAGDALQNSGMTHFFYIMAFISMSIGLVNLAPVPMLDGGHIVMYSFELITGIKPSKKIQEYAFKLGFSLVMALMVFTILNDIGIVSYLKNLS